MESKELLIKYLNDTYVMQVASVSDGQPWICTVYYVIDDALNLYWCSIPERRHSKELASHNRVGISVTVKKEHNPVIGIQGEGEVTVITDPESLAPLAAQYAEQFCRSNEWVEDFTNGRTQHKLYKFNPSSYVLFDEESYPDNPRRIITLKKERD